MIKIIDLLIDLIKRKEDDQQDDSTMPLRIEAPEYEIHEKERSDDEDENNKEKRVIIIDL